ncbi:MAG: putative glycoside hydrolase [Acidimicrobiia bacterium]
MVSRRPSPGLEIFSGRRRHGAGYRQRRARFIRNLFKVLLVPTFIIGLILGVRMIAGMIQPETTHLAILGYERAPLTGAIITADNGHQTTSVEGGSAFIAFDTPTSLRVEAPGYNTAIYKVDALPTEGPLQLQMEPLILQGRVTNNSTGVVGATVRIGEHEVLTAEFGSFEVVAAAPGEVTISKPTWEEESFEWDGSSERQDIPMGPFIIKGIRIFGYDTTNPEYRELLRIADETVINAFAFDTKNEFGEVMYLSEDFEAFPMEAIINKYDVHERLALAKEHGLYTITRIVTFQDEFSARHFPKRAILNSETGEPWRNWQGIGWMDPTDPESWDYPIRMGLEACRFGFDEVQFDYVRFPTDGKTSVAVYDDPEAAATQEGRVATINAFLSEARERINAEGCAVSADIFSIVLSVQNDQGIGQKIEELSWAVDAISPMIYPSHYANGWLNLDNPNNYPEEVIGEALGSSVTRLQGGAHLRPWLQAFGWSAAQIREAIAVADSYGMGWLLWNSQSDFEQDWIPAS